MRSRGFIGAISGAALATLCTVLPAFGAGLLYTNWRRPGDDESIIESKSFWVMGNFSRFVRPGFVRVELAGDRHAFDGLLGSAYLDPKNGKLVLVYINLATESQKVTWTLKKGNAALPQRFVPWVTSGDENLKARAAINVADGFEVPSRSVVTFFSE
jgi:O-glycosyl hydrolase